MTPKVSVCMPVYNGEKYLAQAIESILSQTFGDFELLIGDDCSTDGSLALIQQYAAQDKRIQYWRNDRNLGLFQNWNLTMQKAAGKYIKPFAQDDFCKPKFFDRLVQALDEQPSVAIAGSAREFFNGEKTYAVEPDARKYYRDRIFKGDDVSLMFLVEGINLIGFPPAIMFRKEHLGSGFDTRYFHCGDVEFFMRLLQHGDYYFIYRPLVTYRYHGNNQTQVNFAELRFMSDLILLKHTYGDLVKAKGVENFDQLTASQLAKVVTVGRQLLGVNYDGAEKTPLINDARSVIEIIVSLADRVHALEQQLAVHENVERSEQFQAVIAERDHLRHENHQLHQRLHALLNSTSWRITKPMRAVVRAVGQRI
jgi:glycosyltransferase involved in cell wall biosynthesis